MNKIKKFFIFALVVCFAMSNAVLSFSNSNDLKDLTPYSAESKATIVANPNSKSTTSSMMTRGASPVDAVVFSKVFCIGRGLVDLDTTIEANFVINTVSGTHYYSIDGVKREKPISLYSGYSTSAYFSNQFKETPGKKIKGVGSTGSATFGYYMYSESWETFAYDPNATVQ